MQSLLLVSLFLILLRITISNGGEGKNRTYLGPHSEPTTVLKTVRTTRHPSLSLIFYGQDVNRLDDELNGVADLEAEFFERLRGQHGRHLRRRGHVELHQRHDLIAFDRSNLCHDLVSCSVFHRDD